MNGLIFFPFKCIANVLKGALATALGFLFAFFILGAVLYFGGFGQ